MPASARRVAAAYRQAVTTPLPSSFPATEIGLLTVEEFLALRNPSEKHHPSDAYDFNVAKLNETLYPITTVNRDGRSFTISRAFGEGPADGYVIEEDGQPVAVIHDGTMYYKFGQSLRVLPQEYWGRGGDGDKVDLGVKQTKPVKYVSEYVPLISDVAGRNRKRFHNLLQNVMIKGEPYQVRSEGKPVPGKGTGLAVLNTRGEVVAEAMNEWGATLISVAQEYRGHGLGQMLVKLWYEFNPEFQSGGFTNAGENQAVRQWAARVHEFMAQGWYSELIRQKRLSPARLKEILVGLPAGARHITNLPSDERPASPVSHEPLVYSDGDSTFVVYDPRFLVEQDDKYIHGYGFFRDEAKIGWFLYTIDYERPYARLVTSVAMQMAKDNHEHIYIGQGYGDMLELDGIPHVKQVGDYAWLTSNVLNLKALAAKEARARRANDPYDEKYVLLLEQAESKWR